MNKMLLKTLMTLALTFSLNLMFAQVTTSGMNGKVIGANGESLPGATVIAVHVPSGTQYGTTTDVAGLYRLPNMNVGGPYTLTVSYIGFEPFVKEGIYLSLGQTQKVNANMAEKAAAISGVEIVAERNNLFDGNRTGATTNIGRTEITTMPTINRSINDFTRLSPQSGVGNGFAGRDGRYNNITIDGSNFNNNFGLSSKNLPGGDAQPISLDAIEQISVNVAPYDIRQSNFTGANINAVTRKGDNTLQGSAYTFYRNQDLTGDKAGDQTFELANTSTTSYGARLAGPIIKDKLFFFANAEYEKSNYPGITWNASDTSAGIYPSSDNYISRTSKQDMATMKQYLLSKYGYDPGSYENFDNFESKNYKLLGRIDWNINKNHKLSVRYNYVNSKNDQQVNATSAPNPRSNFGRIGEKSLSFSNSGYKLNNTVSSIVGELNSVFGSTMANKLLVTYTKIQDTRDSDSDPFPFVDIYKDGDPYMSFGYELFTYQNDVKNNVFNITDNFNYFMGKHTFTAGASFEHMYFGNSYKRYGTSYYRYASMEDFMNNALPTVFGLTYPYDGAGDGYAELSFGLGSIYVQDEFQVNDNLKLTAGVRFEMPFYFDDLIQNPNISDSLTFKDALGNDTKLDVGTWPDPQVLFSPRVGFNWDVEGDQQFQVRGGTGIFTGRLPFVWFTNQPTNSGVLQNTIEINSATTIADKQLYFNADPFGYYSKFSSTPGTLASGSSIAIVDKDFKMPQVWRSNLAADIKLPWQDLVLTVEGLYSKDINAVVQFNANQTVSDTTFQGPDQRQRFFSSSRKVNKDISSAMVLTNTDEGYSYMLTLQLTKPFTKGLFGTLSYTYMMAKDVSANPGSTASSAWGSNPSTLNQNTPELSYSQFAIPHRVMGAISYHIEYGNNFGTTISLFYEGANQGRLSYVYSNDMNGDGNSADLMYIPKDASEIQFADIKNTDGDVVFTADQQNTAFWKYVEQDDYLKENKGKYAERYGVLMPWRHRFDLRILQDLYTRFGDSRRHTLQISLDLLNIGNLINSDWGTYKKQSVGNYDITLLKYSKTDANGVPIYQMNTAGKDFPTSTFSDVLSTSSTWGAQIGLRYTF